MIKVDIVNEVSKVADITKVKAEVAVDAVFDAMRLSMQRGERIELRGFGVFQVKPRKRGIGRNPRTGKEVRHSFLGAPSGSTRKGSCKISEDNSAVALVERPLVLRSAAFRRRSRRSLDCVRGRPLWRVPDPPRRFHHVVWKHVLLFLLTLATTTLVGQDHYQAFLSEFGRHPDPGGCSSVACGTA